MFKDSVIYLVENHHLRQICFEDTQFTNPMDLFIALLRVLIGYGNFIYYSNCLAMNEAVSVLVN